VGGGADGVKTRAADPNERSSLGVRAGNSTAISSALELKLIRTAFNLKTKNNSFIMLVSTISHGSRTYFEHYYFNVVLLWNKSHFSSTMPNPAADF